MNKELSVLTFGSPVGPITVITDEISVCAVRFGMFEAGVQFRRVPAPIAQETVRQLQEYFEGIRHVFTVPVAPHGTDFQKKVWSALQTVPYGCTKTYKNIAEQINNPLASRAVGSANNKNPISIIIPCHRIIGTSGKLVGYAAGLPVKQRLLALERRYVSSNALEMTCCREPELF